MASFPFRLLPAEIRTEIWLYALEQNITYAAKWSESRDTCYLMPVRRSSPDVGQTCFEARQLFEKTHQKIKFRKHISQIIDVWINEQTIFFLGQPRAAANILCRFPKSTPPVLRRVVISRPLPQDIHPFTWAFNFLLRNMECSFLGIDDIVIQCSRKWQQR